MMAISSGQLVAIHHYKSLAGSFDVGIILSHSQECFCYRSFDRHGRYEGTSIARIDEVSVIELQGIYLTNTQAKLVRQTWPEVRTHESFEAALAACAAEKDEAVFVNYDEEEHVVIVIEANNGYCLFDELDNVGTVIATTFADINVIKRIMFGRSHRKFLLDSELDV